MSQTQAQIEVTNKPEDKDPHRKKYKKTTCGGEEKKRKETRVFEAPSVKQGLKVHINGGPKHPGAHVCPVDPEITRQFFSKRKAP